ncbi:MAG: GNAT family N-acetyltransferase [Candidatus Symbiothrix sp.]|jgi:hypothetical protein|nr:GNAT family N-acetyltransferase [Candidatus Symbiothrix sp.]
MLEIISPDNRRRWNEIVCSMLDYDFYFLAEYHQLDVSGTPLLLHFQEGTLSIALPVIVRTIEGTVYKDIVSVYGYAGPLINSRDPEQASVNRFQEELKHFFDSSSIVSAFSRLHFFFPYQQHILEGLGTVFDSNYTVGIDLTLPQDKQRKQYASSLKYTINKLRKKGVIVQKASTGEEIDSFVEMYRETMDRVHASEKYYFSGEYFHRFADSIDSFILLAYYEGEAVSGALCTVCNGIMQHHFGATKNNFLFLSPLKLILEEARLLGVRQGCRILHLGGGFKGNADSLFLFKALFSKQRFLFKTWKYVHNQEVYDSLVSQKFKNNIPDSAFFPLYRLTC